MGLCLVTITLASICTVKTTCTVIAHLSATITSVYYIYLHAYTCSW